MMGTMCDIFDRQQKLNRELLYLSMLQVMSDLI